MKIEKLYRLNVNTKIENRFADLNQSILSDSTHHKCK